MSKQEVFKLDPIDRPVVTELSNGKKLFDFTLIKNKRTTPVYKIREIKYEPRGNQPVVNIHGRMNKKNPSIGDYVIVDMPLPRRTFPSEQICCVITNVRKGVLEALWLRNTQTIIQDYHMSFDLKAVDVPNAQMSFQLTFENMVDALPVVIGDDAGHRVYDMRNSCEFNNVWTCDVDCDKSGEDVAITYHCSDAKIPHPVSGDVIIAPPKIISDEFYDSYLSLDGTAFIIHHPDGEIEDGGLKFKAVKLNYPIIYGAAIDGWGSVIATAGRLSGNETLFQLGQDYSEQSMTSTVENDDMVAES
jgi:hypothetical protein